MLALTAVAAPNGSGTFGSVFSGIPIGGNWKLYLTSYDSPGCSLSFSGWSLTLTYNATSNATTTTTITSATVNPVTAGASVGFTASVVNTSTSATPTGTVTFTSTPAAGGSPTTLCTDVALSGSGTTATATCNTSALTSEGVFDINATYNPGTGFVGSSTASPFQEWVNNPTTSGGTDIFCNNGTITGTTQTNTSPYPSVVMVSGIGNAVQNVTVQLKNYSFANEGFDAQMMLVAPNGSTAMVLMSHLGGDSGSASNSGSVTFTDSASLATGTNPLGGSGALSFAPTVLNALPAPFIQTLPGDAPAGEPRVPANAASGTYTGIGVPASVGTATLFSTFAGATADGTWSLFGYTDNNPMSIGGWCLAITPASGVSTTTVVSGSTNPATTGATVAVTATVSSGSATPTGTVSFKDGQTDAVISGCGAAVLTAGGTNSATATCNVSTLSEGDHTITATYSGAAGSFNESFGSYDQRINNAVTASVTGGVIAYCDAGAITIPNPNSVNGGAAYPNPSNIAVAGLFGTVSAVTVTLKNFFDVSPEDLTSLLTGPGGNLDFFSGAGGADATSTIPSLVFEDSAGGQVPASPGTGPYKPTSFPNAGDGFPPLVFTGSPFYPVPGTIHSAASNGSSTFASSFAGTSPNGNWDLFFYNHNTSLASAGYGLGGGWCVNITPTVPTFTFTETHNPASFVQGGTGQTTLNVTNTSAAAVTAGGSAYPVTITDALPNGLSYSSISSGANWTCSGTTTVTCTNPDIVAGGNAYPTLVLNLSVSGTATGGNNPTEVSEGPPGTFGTPTGLSAADNIPVIAPPVFSVTEGHTGTFTQGQTAGILTITVSNTAGASSLTQGTTTVTETLPAGYTTASSPFSTNGWSCSGTGTVTCTSTQAVAGGADFGVIDIAVTVPTTALNPTTTNAATASGGGALASAISGTDSFPVVQVPHSMTAGSGTTPQSAAVNTAFGTALSVTVDDAAGNPVSGVSVTFTAPASGASGTFSNSTNTIAATTNSSGVASAGVFTANGSTGGPYSVTATATGLTSVNFSLTNTVGTATHFSVVAPGAASQGAPFSFTVTALDAGNNTATGYTGTVHFTSTDGTATLPANFTFTLPAGGSGTFSATLTTPGNQTITATDIVSPSITGTSGLINVTQVAHSLTPGTGSTPQSATVSTAFGTPLSVTLTDLVGNPIPGVNVVFTAPSTGASGTFSNSSNTIAVATNASGVASAGVFRANSIVGGPYSVTATVTGLTPATFSLTNNPGAATHFSVVAPGATSQGSPLTFTVTALDSANNVATGYTGTVHFTSTDGTASLPANFTFTPAAGGSGTFSATLNTSGNQTITVTDIVTPAITGTSGLINVTQVAHSITAGTGTTPQSASINTAFGTPLSVTVRDLIGQPISGVGVVFAAPTSGASGVFGNSSTTITVSANSSGVASAGLFTANSMVGGPYSVTATVTGLTPVTFSLTNTGVGTPPAVVSFNVLFGTVGNYPLIGSARNRLPWEITGVQVTFSQPIAAGDINSLSGVGITTTGFSGLGTATLTWTVAPLSLGSFQATLAATGPDALMNSLGTPMTTAFSQTIKVLWGDVNDDGLVNSADLVLVNNGRAQTYNILYDVNGDGVVDVNDVTVVRSRLGTSLP
jgi:hypothetical protein